MPKVPELSEKDFIQESYGKDPYPLWLWLFLLLIVVSLAWAGITWYQDKMGAVLRASPFLQVTNRQLSLFLWQNPEFMRVNVKERSNYLPGFLYTDKITADIAYADEYAVAPPEVLFRYHTWDRLLKSEFSNTPISPDEFAQFLSYDEQWQPRYWAAAPQSYVDLVESISDLGNQNLSLLPLATLPLDVRIAFQGWKNYFKDGEALNQIRPTLKHMQQFLASHPHYARNYWRNILMEHIPAYLASLEVHQGEQAVLLPSDELSGFLRVALFNYSTMENPSG